MINLLKAIFQRVFYKQLHIKNEYQPVTNYTPTGSQTAATALFLGLGLFNNTMPNNFTGFETDITKIKNIVEKPVEFLTKGLGEYIKDMLQQVKVSFN